MVWGQSGGGIVKLCADVPLSLAIAVAAGTLSYYTGSLASEEGSGLRGALHLLGYRLTSYPGLGASQLYLSCTAPVDTATHKDLLMDLDMDQGEGWESAKAQWAAALTAHARFASRVSRLPGSRSPSPFPGERSEQAAH